MHTKMSLVLDLKAERITILVSSGLVNSMQTMHECHYIFHMDLVLNSCNCRWHNHLNPDIRKDAWTPGEERDLINAHRVYGNKWAEIAKVLPGRYFHTAIPFLFLSMHSFSFSLNLVN
jgi:hypothetical protein